MKRRKKKDQPLIVADLLQIKKVPEQILIAEKVTEKLLDKKLTPKQKASVKYKAAIKNYRKAVTRYKLAETLLKKHTKILTRLNKKHS